jgi:DNA polymerase-3 subunit delta
MKIPPAQIDHTLRQLDTTQLRTILLYGPEEGLIESRAELCIERFLGRKANAYEVIRVSYEGVKAAPGAFMDQIRNRDFLAPKKIMWIRDCGATFHKEVQQLFRAVPTHCFVIWVSSGELTPSSSFRKWFEQAENALSVPCYTEEGNNLIRTVERTLNVAGLVADQSVVRYLAEHLAGNRLHLENEITKLSLYMGDENRVLDVGTVAQVIGEVQPHSLDQLYMFLAGGKLQESIEIVRFLLEEGNVPVSILRSLTRSFSRLWQIHELIQQGLDIETAMKRLKPPIFFKQAPFISQHVKWWNLPAIQQVLHRLYEAEAQSKQTGADGALILERLFLFVTHLAHLSQKRALTNSVVA